MTMASHVIYFGHFDYHGRAIRVSGTPGAKELVLHRKDPHHVTRLGTVTWHEPSSQYVFIRDSNIRDLADDTALIHCARDVADRSASTDSKGGGSPTNDPRIHEPPSGSTYEKW